MSGEIILTNSTDIISPLNHAADIPKKICENCVQGITIDTTVFILGSILILIVGTYIVLAVFGYPIFVSNESASKGSIIQHTNTPKSAILKVAKLSGGGFRYKNIKDGTVATATNSVYNIMGRNLVITFAQLGITIPVNILAGISILVHQDIKNIVEFKNKYMIEVDKKVLNSEGIEEIIKVKAIKKELILSGYNFDNFSTLKKQTQEEKLIPLTIEAFSDFNEKNIASDTSERYVKTKAMIIKETEIQPNMIDTMKWIIAIVILLMVGFILVK
jgi:hypothetical protein